MIPVPQLKCRCGFCGPIYAFVSIDGHKAKCVRCAGSKVEALTPKQRKILLGIRYGGRTRKELRA